MSEMILNPGKSVGLLVFGSAPFQQPREYGLKFDQYMSGGPIEESCYTSEKSGIRADYLDGKLNNVASRKSLIFRENELIGASLSDLIKRGLFENQHIEYDEELIFLDEGPQRAVYIDGLGITLWIDSENVVRSVDCSRIGLSNGDT